MVRTGGETVPSALQVAVVPVTPFQQNCSILICVTTRRAAVIDPGGDGERLLEAVRALDVTVEKIFLTHGHLDHCGGASALRDRWGVPIEGPHRDDRFWIDRLEDDARRWGFPPLQPFESDRYLEDLDQVRFGEIVLDVRHCPGHTPGHVVFFHGPSRLAAVGDVLFHGSIGRSDFPRGNHAVLIRSIRERLWPMGDDVTFIPGHGPTSTFGHERRTNPFVGEGAPGVD